MDAGARLLVSDGCSEMVSVKGSEDEPRDDHRQSTSGGGLAATKAIPFTNPITGNQIKVYVNPKPGTLRGDAETPGRLVRRAPTSLPWRAQHRSRAATTYHADQVYTLRDSGHPLAPGGKTRFENVTR